MGFPWAVGLAVVVVALGVAGVIMASRSRKPPVSMSDVLREKTEDKRQSMGG